jgi:hypothetical protein
LLSLSLDFHFQGRSPGCFRRPSDLAALPALPRDTGDDRTQPYIRHYAEPVPEEPGSRPVTSSTPLKFRARFDLSLLTDISELMRLIGTISGIRFFAEIGCIRPQPIAVGAAAGFVGAGMAAGVAWAIEVFSVVCVASVWAIGASISTSTTGSTFRLRLLPALLHTRWSRANGLSLRRSLFG